MATRILGREYSRSRGFIEIDITYVCNLRCAGCNRSCPQAPTAEMMTIEEIKKFVAESIENSYRWQRIRIVGGEPTMHPQIHQIVEILLNYKKDFSPQTRIMLVTNGVADITKKVISEMPVEVEIDNSEKAVSRDNFFERFNIAPIDEEKWQNAEFTNGCKILKHCGTGLSPYGYYPCAIAASIDRVYGLDLGRKSLPGKDDDMYDLLNTFCRYCGHFRDERPRVINNSYSSSWIKAYEKYRKGKRALKRYV